MEKSFDRRIVFTRYRDVDPLVPQESKSTYSQVVIGHNANAMEVSRGLVKKLGTLDRIFSFFYFEIFLFWCRHSSSARLFFRHSHFHHANQTRREATGGRKTEESLIVAERETNNTKGRAHECLRWFWNS